MSRAATTIAISVSVCLSVCQQASSPTSCFTVHPTAWEDRHKYCDQRVCLSVCAHISKPRVQTSRNFLCMMSVTLLVRRQEGHPACKKTEWWDAGMVISLERGADLHMAQLMPLSLALVKSRSVLPFLYRLTRSPKKVPLNACVCYVRDHHPVTTARYIVCSRIAGDVMFAHSRPAWTRCN